MWNELNQSLVLRTVCWLLLSLWLIACSDDDDESDSDNDNQVEQPANTAPTVSAGADQDVSAGATVTLAATITDDDETLTIVWSQTSGTTVTLADASAATTTFTAPDVQAAETLVFQVSVGDNVNNAVTDSVSISVSPEVSNEPDTPAVLSAWVLNTDQTRSTFIIEDASTSGVLVNVQSVTEETVSGAEFAVVTTEGIPDYGVTVTQDLIDDLNARPSAATDFVSGSATINVNDVVAFGQDIGFRSSNDCDAGEGFGYWPPGPVCPTQQSKVEYLPQAPAPTDEDCGTGLGAVGLWVNGASVYNWGDGQSYNGAGDWQNLAPIAEQYDVDICGGHAANGDYHHHFYSSCLADLVNDVGDDHSPIYGFAADGYPIYGPWQADGQLVISSWVTRDYTAGTATGCDDGLRSCSLVDPYDLSQGTEAVTAGPGFNETVTTLSGNELTAVNGYYFEDYYWDSTLTAQGGLYLDQYNGHSDETRGYHYHITVTEENDTLSPSFPFTIGDSYAGELADNALANCSNGQGPGGGGPPGGPGQ